VGTRRASLPLVPADLCVPCLAPLRPLTASWHVAAAPTGGSPIIQHAKKQSAPWQGAAHPPVVSMQMVVPPAGTVPDTRRSSLPLRVTDGARSVVLSRMTVMCFRLRRVFVQDSALSPLVEI
jgi:hypothetical protein